MKVAVIGGGAAGFFAAIAVMENHPKASVVIFEKSEKLLAKVKVSGGGKCNVTNACPNLRDLVAAYPRGGKALKKAFGIFNNHDMMRWLEAKGITLKTRPDNHVFPASQDSQTIIDCFTQEAAKHNIKIETGSGVSMLKLGKSGWQLEFTKQGSNPRTFDKVIVATGGSPKRVGLKWLEDLGHEIVGPIPSLFTFNMPDEPIRELMGVAVEGAIVSIQSTKLKFTGPVLITHWGMSGPAILKLSAYGARVLAEKDYRFRLQINWTGIQNSELVVDELRSTVSDHPKKRLCNIKPIPLPERLWHYLLQKAGIPMERSWGELGKKGINKLVNELSNSSFEVQGKTSFKDEFVTCGGVSLSDVNMRTMESRVCPNLYFTGEVLDIDGITGGYNFQAAWTTAFIAGRLGK